MTIITIHINQKLQKLHIRTESKNNRYLRIQMPNIYFTISYSTLYARNGIKKIMWILVSLKEGLAIVIPWVVVRLYMEIITYTDNHI